MTVCIYRHIHTTALCYWPDTTGMTHLKITSSGFFWMRQWIVWFHKMQGISWLAEGQSASQERLCTTESISWSLFQTRWSLSSLFITPNNSLTKEQSEYMLTNFFILATKGTRTLGTQSSKPQLNRIKWTWGLCVSLTAVTSNRRRCCSLKNNDCTQSFRNVTGTTK